MGTIKLYKKYKRLNEGGVTPNQQFSQGVGYGNTALQVANIGNQMFGDQGNEFGVKDDFASTAGGALSGAASGAAMGSMLGPWGTLGGAAIGGVAGAIKAGKTNKEAKERQALYEEQRKQLAIQNSQNQWQQTLNNGFQMQGNMNAQKYAKNGGLLYKKMGDGGKLKPAKIYTDKAEFLKAKEAYNDSLYLHNRSNSIVKELEKQGFNKSEKSGINEQFNKEDLEDLKNFVPKDKRYYESKDSTRTILTGVDDKFKGINTKKEIPFVSKMMFHKNILPDSVQTMSYKDPYTYKGGKQSHETLEEWQTNNGKEVEGSRRITKDLKTLSDTSTISYNTEEDALLYKKPNQPVKFVPDIPLPIRQTLMKPPTKKVERAPGLGGFNRIMKNGGNVQQLSKTNVQFNGNSHENGGIKEPLVNGVRLDGTEVEGNESMSTSNGQKFVFSENLGFAQQHKPLARAMGKIEKKLKANPNDPISKRTLNSLKEREEQLKVKQEETKEALGLENNLGEMRMGGAIKRKDGVYIDREGVMKYPLKNGGMVKYAPGGLIDDTFDKSGNWASGNEDGFQNNFVFKGRSRGRVGDNNTYSYDKLNDSFTMNGKSIPNTQNNYLKSTFNITNSKPYLPSNPTLADQAIFDSEKPQLLEEPVTKLYGSRKPLSVTSTESTTGTTPGATSKSKVNWGNVAGKIIPYAGVASNYMLNEQARRMTTPKEALPDYVKYKPVDYSASKIEADQQRRQLNKSLTQNVTNSAVAAALKAKNLATTIGAKNLINQEETNVNTKGVNRINLVNNQIQQRRNQIDVENRDRDYNKEQRYLTQKGEIANNFSDIYQQQGRDRRLYDLEDRKIDVLRDVDTGRGVYKRNLEDDTKKQKESYKKGGIVKKTNKLYNKSKK